MSDYTPGPWMVQIKKDKTAITSYSVLTHIENAICVCQSDYWPEDYEPITDQFGYCQPDEYMDCDPSKIANARLIAAAPDLLEALENLERTAGLPAMENDPSRVAARAAIAKAKGETK